MPSPPRANRFLTGLRPLPASVSQPVPARAGQAPSGTGKGARSAHRPGLGPGTPALACSQGLRAQSGRRGSGPGGPLCPGAAGVTGGRRCAALARAAAGSVDTGGGNAKVFPEDKRPRGPPGPLLARQQSSCALRAAGPTREAGPLPASGPSPARPSPDPRPRGPSRSGWRAGSDRAAGSNWCLPGTQRRPSREQKQPPAPELREGGLAGRGRGAGSEEPGPGNGTPPGGAPKLPSSPVWVGGGLEAGGQGAESAPSAPGARKPAAGL